MKNTVKIKNLKKENQDGGGQSVISLRFVSKVKCFYILVMKEKMRKEEEEEEEKQEGRKAAANIDTWQKEV